ncbi:MAG: hypothetical protein PHV34_25035 [Verrucomicrobiae bacterium]|nr:hypothetical protein [Verrucomicrobiae bacterium]
MSTFVNRLQGEGTVAVSSPPAPVDKTGGWGSVFESFWRERQSAGFPPEYPAGSPGRIINGESVKFTLMDRINSGQDHKRLNHPMNPVHIRSKISRDSTTFSNPSHGVKGLQKIFMAAKGAKRSKNRL